MKNNKTLHFIATNKCIRKKCVIFVNQKMIKNNSIFMEYYITTGNGKYIGPFGKDKLIANGLTSDTLVWREGMTAWTPARLLRELDDITGEMPPPLEMTLSSQSVEQPPALEQEINKLHMENSRLNSTIDDLKNKEIDLKTKKIITKEKKVISTEKKTSTLKNVETSDKSVNKNVKQKTKKKTGKKTKYDFPVCTWIGQTFFILACVLFHIILALDGDTTFFYIYLDFVGLAICIVALIIGFKIRKLNKISYEKDSPSRITADKLGYYNGILVSGAAAVGFLIILVQSSLYVYTS